jgi:SulP family sulfate permease
MLELSTLRTAWRYDRSDALTLLATLAGVLVLGIEAGVVLGVMLSMGNLIWRASRPHIAVLGRIAGSEHFRNIERHPAQTMPLVLMLRIDANLFFGNVEAVNARIEEELKAHPKTEHLVLVMTAVSSIDTSALFGLEELNQALRQRGIGLHLAEVKGPVMDRLRDSNLIGTLNGQVFLSAVMAAETLQGQEEWAI